ncbi:MULTISPECIES: hypothetical protein [Psychrilyobacter]|uniref:Uncharacterized protein n=1 Tax=Psychrilyobacter piezotolerans TaxID=2293438 RepID=A0ABX9KJT0_9FUSO|nr:MULTISPECIES: hypothetical protein [Psychrilyobacter]MCS5420791.1 hypothetical protein [Psychrilyobacter sp. S5]NDI77415.1 hypothetical protein [Psychrilyobacter piezotolerans]RDE63718.1 hypothetical protein DV867_04910 [Psychrilyobacter sp. S5]REI42062.1 hypothetical protein DYH56_04910 [Psychrilyobacter piezotolerans]
MKKKLILLGIIAIILSLAAYVFFKEKDYSGTYKGVYWKDHSKGVSLKDAKQKIETVLTLEKNGTISNAKIDFLVLKNGKWIARNDPEADVSVDFSVDPVAAAPGSDYKNGISMFNIKTNDMMGFYAVAVDDDGTVALVILDAVIRYQLEAKFEPGFDFNSKFRDLTINRGLVPTVRASKSGLLKPKDWSELEGKHLYAIHPYNNVIKNRGILKGTDGNSTLLEFLTALGVEFKTGVPEKMDVKYGFHSNGGWKGNYDAIENYLIGKNANEVKSLIDWSSNRYSESINKNNYFGIDLTAGATKTVQNSFEGIAGATVRMSRENTSYMAALVEAGILDEKDVIKGRF